MNKKKIFLSIFFMLFLVFVCNTSTSFGAKIVDYSYNSEDGSYTLDYVYHGMTEIYEDTVVLPSTFFDGTYDRWCLFVNDDNILTLFYSTNEDFSYWYFCPNSSGYSASSDYNTQFLLTDRALSKGSSDYGRLIYSDGTWIDGYNMEDILPTGFIFSRSCEVYFCNKLISASDSLKYTNINSRHPYEITSVSFFGTTPYLIELNESVYKIALGNLYDGYTFVATDELPINVTETTLNDMYLYIDDITDGGDNCFWCTSLSDLSPYIEDNEEYGKILNLPLDNKEFLNKIFFESPDDFFIDGHTYQFEFKVSGTNKVQPQSHTYTYLYYDKCSLVDTLVYGSGGTTIPDTEEDDTNTQINTITNTIVESNKEVTNSINEQTNAIKEQTETSKGIWGTIKEILSYLNPFSENFFAYKLVSLLLDGLKSLFVPSDGFFDTFFDELKTWFEEKLGFLFYPFELIIDVLNRILNIDFSEPLIEIPDINEPFTGVKLISATSFNFNTLLENSVFKNIHDIYLIVVDAIIVFCLVNLAKRKFEEVTTK